MKRDIDEHGYCLVKEALTPEQLAEARERLSEQAEAERVGATDRQVISKIVRF